MILQQLTIHNIASIEDATIDFEAHPLADSEVFLITGKTGAGKSTILDAICLALYATTPRLDSTNMQGNTKDHDKDIRIKDPVQLMRRNTSEAYAQLTFTGSNGSHYEATWQVARAYKKITGNIKAKTWQLRNLDTDFTYTKDKEIKDEIARAIGLDFGQFCRTTLLAQGEFTRFLNSKDDDKAEILEKITGADAYSKIGMKIFEETSEKRKAWEEAQQKTAGIILLSEEDTNGKKAELAEMELQDRQLNEEATKIQQKLDWIKEEQELHQRQAQAQEALLQAQAIMASDEKKEEERIITQWNYTIEARHWLHETEVQATHIEQLKRSLASYRNDYILLQGAHLHEVDAAAAIAQQKGQIDKFLQSEESKVSLYENVQSIHAHMRIIEEGRKKIADYQKDILSLKSQLRDMLSPQLAKAKENLALQQQSLESLAQELLQASEALETLNLPALRHQCDDQKDVASHITEAQSTLEQYNKEKLRLEEAQANLANLGEDIKQKEEQAKLAVQQAHDACIEKDTAKAIHEKQRESINEWAKSIRIQLHIGDICPVCQQKVTTALPHEDSIDALVAQTSEVAKAAEKKYEKLADKKNQLEANLQALSNQYKKDSHTLDKDRKMLCDMEQKLKKVIDSCQLATIVQAEEIRLHYTDGICATLTLAYQKTQAQIALLTDKVSKGEAKEQQVKTLQKAVEKQRKLVEQMKDAANRAEKMKDEGEHQIINLQSLSASKETEVNEAFGKAKELTGSQDWSPAPLAYAQQLIKAATTYNKQKEERLKLDNNLAQYRAYNENVGTTIEGILQYMPDWKSISPESIQRQHLDNLPERATRLQAQVASALSQTETAQQALNNSKKLLHDFITQQPMELSLLKSLNTYSQTTIAAMTKELDKAKQALTQKEALLKEATSTHKAHLEKAQEAGLSQTEIAEMAETSRSLNSRLQDIGTLQQELSVKRGGIMRDLEIDRANLQKIGKLKEEEEAKKAVYSKWNRLNQLLGDSTGSKFRRIAQSYVLASLIHSANGYMRTLTDRYVLHVVPGTFVITMEDAYQGYTSRAASTLSGGESFLVSLSLALALSDIGQQLAVDTLFIDEGFGTLSGEPLQHAINTLRGLHTQSGRHVGIISHVEELKERIPVQIRVNQEGNNSSSSIEIVG